MTRARDTLCLFAVAVLLLTSSVDAEVRRYSHPSANNVTLPGRTPQFIIVDLEAELPSDDVGEGDIAYASDTDNVLKHTGSTWVALAGGAGAPTTATYMTQIPDGGLSNEQAWSLLTTGLVLNTTTTGVASIYAGTSCAGNNWMDVLSASGVATCSTVSFTQLGGTAVDSQIPNDITISLAAAATALAADPANCVNAVDFAVGVNASGVATCEPIADADVPDSITVSLAAAATALAANPADCATSTHFAVGVDAGGIAVCEAIGDADVPNTITVDLATLATTATTANAGDSATAFFPSGLLEVAIGGTGSAPASDDQVLVSNSTSTATWKSVPDCGEAGTLNYTAATNTFSCLTDSGGGGGGNAVTTSVAVTSDGMFFQSTVAASWAASGSAIVCRPHGGGASTPTAESIVVSGVEAITTAIVAGVGFDLMVRNPYGLEGTVEFRCVGV